MTRNAQLRHHAEAQRLARLEALANAVREGLSGLPSHPWIPGGSKARPVRDALLLLDGHLRDSSGADIPVG